MRALDKIPIEGIKLSEELFHLSLVKLPEPQKCLSRLCRGFSEKQINMPFIAAACRDEYPCASCCVAIEDLERVVALLAEDRDLKDSVQITESVGLLSVFPHQSSLRFLGISLHALGEAQIPVYGLSSSLAPLTFVIEYACLDKAVEALEKYLVLPANQRPIRAQFQVKQSRITKDQQDEKG